MHPVVRGQQAGDDPGPAVEVAVPVLGRQLRQAREDAGADAQRQARSGAAHQLFGKIWLSLGQRAYAIELTADVCWRFYRQWGQGTRAVTRLITRDPVRRLRLSVNAFLTFPFGRPGYQFDDVPQADGRSLDMQRCPVADYLGSRGAADLCAGSWCNLDYSLAEMWGGTLERSGTLVAGASCCDFRFRVPGTPEAPFEASPERVLPMVPA